ncbi:MAG: beta-ketoacyl-ACP synthase [Alphaproteobacteria bacterium]|nr:beta-ketoacyl-ACP synthase [Alphaproteobacteria bacterium]MDF1625844.1 beta-ketoacyl-ACP synthase [Parvibaculaceae bacterium]
MSNAPTYLPALGVVSALGQGCAEVAANLFAGSTQGMKRRSDLLSDGQSTIVGAVTAALPPVPAQLAAYQSRNLQLAILAVEQIRVPLDGLIAKYGPSRIGVIMGSSTSGIDCGEAAIASYEETGVFPAHFDIRMQELGSVSESLAIYLGLAGPAYTISTACSSGANAMAAGRRMLETGLVDAVLAGGVDTLCRLTLNGFRSLSALSYERCNPFSKNRTGINIGEGAAIFLMTRDESEVALWGTGAASDGHSMTAPEPDGEGVEIAIRAALKDADRRISEICYVHLHGTGTVQNDQMESRLVRRLLGEGVPASSSKAQIGHTLGAAGAMGAAHCWLAARGENEQGLLPPHIWDGEADGDLLSTSLVTIGQALPSRANRLFLSNAIAFGGNNSSLVIGCKI